MTAFSLFCKATDKTDRFYKRVCPAVENQSKCRKYHLSKWDRDKGMKILCSPTRRKHVSPVVLVPFTFLPGGQEGFPPHVPISSSCDSSCINMYVHILFYYGYCVLSAESLLIAFSNRSLNESPFPQMYHQSITPFLEGKDWVIP